MENNPKKRGRKPKQKSDAEEKVLKKRGRKKKIKTDEDQTEDKIPKKRGRKKKDKLLTDEDIENKKKIYTVMDTNIMTEYDNTIVDDLIICLPITLESLKKIDFSSNDVTYNQKENNNHIVAYNSSNSFTTFNPMRQQNVKVNKTNTVMPHEYNMNNKSSWVKTTSIKCYHCTYNFNGMPYSIPYKYIKDTYYVYGNFCSFECAYAYLLSHNIPKKEESISLLFLLNRDMFKLDKVTDIIPAPNKEVLIDYGGTMTIDEFRKSKVNKYYTICIPPIESISHQVEEYNIGATTKKNTLESNKPDKINLFEQFIKKTT